MSYRMGPPFGGRKGSDVVLGVATILEEEEGALLEMSVSQQRWEDPRVTLDFVMSPDAYERLGALVQEIRESP